MKIIDNLLLNFYFGYFEFNFFERYCYEIKKKIIIDRKQKQN